MGHDTLRLHTNVAASIDAMLSGKQPATQLRKKANGKFIARFEVPEVSQETASQSWLTSLAKAAERM